VVQCPAVHRTAHRSRRYVLVFVAVTAIVGCGSGRDAEPGQAAESGDVDVFDLDVGDCLADFKDAAEWSSIEASPCSEPHSDEIYAKGEIPDTDEYPGKQAIETAAQDICLSHYEAFVGLRYDDSVLDIGYLTPTEDSWAEGDRTVLCTIFDPLEEVTGSLRGAER
jgi:Septum formation